MERYNTATTQHDAIPRNAKFSGSAAVAVACKSGRSWLQPAQAPFETTERRRSKGELKKSSEASANLRDSSGATPLIYAAVSLIQLAERLQRLCDVYTAGIQAFFLGVSFFCSCFSRQKDGEWGITIMLSGLKARKA